MKPTPLLIVGALLLTGGAQLWPATTTDTAGVWCSVGAMVAGFSCAIAATRRPGVTLLSLVVLGIVARTPVLHRDPVSSSDLWRYLWEGRVTVAGENPAMVPPSSPRLETLRDTEVWEQVNHKDVATIYLPVAQGLFALAELCGGTPLAWKTLLLLLEIVATLAVARACRRRGRSLLPAVLWLWNPLLVIESSAAGHVDPAGASLLVIALAAALDQGAVRAWLICASSLTKPMAAPLLALSLRSLAGLGWAVLGIAAAILSFIPFLENPVPRGYRVDEEAVLEERAPEPEALTPGALDMGSAAHGGLEALFGTYFVVWTRDDPYPKSYLSFDGEGSAELRRDLSPLVRMRYRLNDDGSFTFVDASSGEAIRTFRLSDDRMTLRGDMGLVGLKRPARPFSAFQDFGRRWSNRLARPHKLLEDHVTNRAGVRIIVGIGVVLIVVLALRRRWAAEGTALALAAWTITLLPVIYPWYLVWLLPGAVLSRNAAWVACGAAAAPLAHILLT